MDETPPAATPPPKQRTGRKPKPVPAAIDWTLPLKVIAKAHKVAPATAHRWKIAAGHGEERRRTSDMPLGIRKKTARRWERVTAEHWAQGYDFVATKMRITPAGARYMHKRLKSYGLAE